MLSACASNRCVALRKLIRAFLRAAQNLPAADLLPATTRRGALRSGLLCLELSLDSDDFDLDRINPLLNAALADRIDDVLIWDRVYDAITESTPPPRPIVSSLQQTPWLRNTGSFANSSEHREHVDNVLKEELGPIYVDLRDFHKKYFGDVPNLETASKTFFKDCLEGSNPLFGDQRCVCSDRGLEEVHTRPLVSAYLSGASDRCLVVRSMTGRLLQNLRAGDLAYTAAPRSTMASKQHPRAAGASLPSRVCSPGPRGGRCRDLRRWGSQRTRRWLSAALSGRGTDQGAVQAI